MLLASLWIAARCGFRRRFQYSLRTLLLIVTLFALPCGWLGVKMQQARRQRQAAAAIEMSGGVVYWTEPSGPIWLRTLLGDDCFKQVRSVSTSTELENLKSLPQLQWLYLSGSNVTDAGLENLKGLSRIEELSLAGTDVTDAGLENIEGLSQLEMLFLAGTNFTDAGLEHIKGMTQLRFCIRPRHQDNRCRAGAHRRLETDGVFVPQRRLPSPTPL